MTHRPFAVAEVAPGIWEGSQPQTAADFQELRQHGIRTIVSLRTSPWLVPWERNRARQNGIADATIAAIAERRRPESMAEDEAAVYDFCSELQQQQGISDPTYARVLTLFGEQGVVDLLGINGYYTFLSLVMNGAGTPAPPSTAKPLPDLP